MASQIVNSGETQQRNSNESCQDQVPHAEQKQPNCDSLPPISYSPQVVHNRQEHNSSSGVTDNRKRGKGAGLFPMVVAPGSNGGGATSKSRASNYMSFQSDGQAKGRKGKYRMSSNHTQLIHKTKASLFDVNTANKHESSQEMSSAGVYRNNGARAGLQGREKVGDQSRKQRKSQGKVSSVRRTSNEKINEARQGYYACQCTEQLLSGDFESNRFMSHLDCPDHLPGPGTTAQLRTARLNRQFKTNKGHHQPTVGQSNRDDASNPVSAITGTKAKIVKSAQVGEGPNKKQKQVVNHKKKSNNHIVAAAAAAESTFSGSGGPNDADTSINNHVESMRKTHLTIVGQTPQQFTPQKPKLRKTFQQDNQKMVPYLNQGAQTKTIRHQQRLQQNRPVRVIPQEDIKFSGATSRVQGPKKRLFGQTIDSDKSSRDGGYLGGPKTTSSGHQQDLVNDQASSANSGSNELGMIISGAPGLTTGQGATVNQMMRMQQVLNASSEKIKRRSGMQHGLDSSNLETHQQTPKAADQIDQLEQLSPEDIGGIGHSSFGGGIGAAAAESTDYNHQASTELYINENPSALQSVEKVYQEMRSEKEMYLEELRRNQEARHYQLIQAEHPISYESPGKPPQKLITGLSKSNQSVDKHNISPRSSGPVKEDKKLLTEFSATNMLQPKLQTEVKAAADARQAPKNMLSKNMAGKTGRPTYAVPVNTHEKQSQIGKDSQKFKNSSPLVMRLSNHSSMEQQQNQVPKVNFNLLEYAKDQDHSSDVKSLILDDKQEDKASLIIPTSKDDNALEFVTKALAQEQIAQIPAQLPAKLGRLGASQKNLVYDYSEQEDKLKGQTPRGTTAVADFDTHQKSPRVASAHGHLDRSPKMGDITNITRQQSQAEVQQPTFIISSKDDSNFAGTEKQLSFRRLKNHRAAADQKRADSSAKSSNEEAIRSEIASDIQMECSDELAVSQGVNDGTRRASGRDFSCIFDADSEGPKQEKLQIQIDKARQQELQTVKRGQQLGEGSFGKVFQGLYDGAQSQYSGSYGSDENALPPQMAIKVVFVEDNRLLNKLEAELELLRTLKHRHIVQYYGCLINEEEKEASIFMELMPHSLQTQYRNFGGLHERVIKRHTKQILEALCYLHNHEPRIIHGDLKAANILSDAGCTKLTDFGDSRKLEALPQDLHASAESGAVFNEFKGSILWMAPECFTRKPVGRRSDIWSLGCTLIELASAQHPWHGIKDLYHLIQKLEMQELPNIPPTLSPLAQDFIRKCLIYEKEMRPTAQDLLEHPFINDGETSAKVPEKASMTKQ